MDLCNPSEVRTFLSAHGLSLSKALGQNFLTDRTVVERIADAAGLCADIGVLEIGPGLGVLTEQLARRAGRVVSLEVDRRLLPLLALTLQSYNNTSIVHGDILKTNLGEICHTHLAPLRPVVCANLPYYITTPVLTMLINAQLFSQITVMVQKEAAQRICALPGTDGWGVSAIHAQFYTSPRILFEVPRTAFLPAPQVDSAILQLTPHAALPLPPDRIPAFFRVVQSAFSQRRKTLLNALSSAYPTLERTQMTNILTSCGIDPRARGETLDISTFMNLSDRLTETV